MLEWVNTNIALLTLIVLAWTLIEVRRYVHAAREQVKASLEQVEVLHRPLLIMVWETMDRGENLGYEMLKAEPGKPFVFGIVPSEGLRIRNVGNGPALNVSYVLIDKNTGQEVPALSLLIPYLEVSPEPFQTHISWNHLANHERLEFALTYESLGDVEYKTKVSIDRREKLNHNWEFAVTQVKTVRQSN